MAKKLLFLFSFAFVILLPGLVRAEQIRSFDVTARIQADAMVDISEKIQYDFGTAEKHGIFRSIPYKYKSQIGNQTLRLNHFAVTDENGKNLTYELSKQDTDIVVRIGDANLLVSGVQTYVINYKVEGAINYFETNDEFYWNITGNSWSVPIKSASANIFLPSNTNVDKIHLFCYAGAFGSNTPCQNIKSGNLNIKSGNPIVVNQKDLLPQNGLTVAVSFPKGVVSQPSKPHLLLNFLEDNLVILLPILIFLILFFKWKNHGRDPKGAGVIITQYDAPDHLTPIEVGAIFDQSVNDRDISAEIINLAVQGYIRINRVEKNSLLFKDHDYEFTQLKPAQHLTNEHDKLLIKLLFGQSESAIKAENVSLSSFKDKTSAYDDIQNIVKNVNEKLVANDYFRSNPTSVRNTYIMIGVIVIIFGSTLYITNSIVGLICGLLSGILIIFFGWLMPARTKKGVQTKEYILGLKSYLTVAEKDRLEFHNAPEKNPQQFEKLLPYAMALGVEKEWAKQFENMYLSPTSWYGGYGNGQFTAILLTSSLGDFRSNMQSTFISGNSSAARHGSGSGGGGFSGGGFGGGGGGSW